MGTDQRFLKVLNYIDDNLNEAISLQELANIAGYSIPQFYRLFKQLTGETVSEFLLRRRMAEAAVEVKKGKKTIAEIAFCYGFQSHDVFTRSFRRVYGMTPMQYQHSDTALQPLKCLEILEKDISERQRVSLKTDQEELQQMIFSIIERPPFQVVGLECNAHTWDSDGAIGNLWCEFLNKISTIRNITEPASMYGICEEETCKDDQFVYMAAIGVEKTEAIPHGMKVRTYDSQKYIKARVPEKIATPDAYVCVRDYAKSLGYEIELKDEIEVYEEDFKDPDVNRFQLLIPIR